MVARVITERDLQTLAKLDDACQKLNGWVRPGACGGRGHSHHSITLERLAFKGYAERQNRGVGAARRCWEYRITDAGRAALRNPDTLNKYRITQSPTELAYLAGLIDGEGCICVFPSRGKTNGKIYPRGRPIINIANTHEGVLRWVERVAGGRVYQRKELQSGWRPVCVWESGWQHARMVLEACAPYLIIKRRQADLFIEFCKTCRRNGSGGVPETILSRRDQIIEEMAALNRRGASDAVEPRRRPASHEESRHTQGEEAIRGGRE